MNRSDALIFVSENQRAHCTKLFMRGRRTLTIHNGVDATRFNPLVREQHRGAIRARLGLRPDEYVIGQSAAFRPEKNHGQSVSALAALRSRGIRARLLFLGDGPGLPDIKSFADSLGLSDAIIFGGRHTDVVPWLSAFDVGILTSKNETFSLAALEFMAMGIPAVLSDTGGANEMVVDGVNGWTFPVSHTGRLVASLETLGDPAKRRLMGDAAAERVAERFTLEKMISQYDHLFRTLAVS